MRKKTFSYLFGVSQILFWGIRVASAQDTLSFSPLCLSFPTNIAGIPRAATDGTNLTYQITGWVNSNLSVQVTATTTAPPTYATVMPFAALQQLLVAYRNADVQAVKALYEPSSADFISTTLADPTASGRWAAFVTNVVALTPLVIWYETNRVNALTWACFDNGGTASTNKELFPLSFDASLRLKAGMMDSRVANDLSIYFANFSRTPTDLLCGTNTAPSAALRKGEGK